MGGLTTIPAECRWSVKKKSHKGILLKLKTIQQMSYRVKEAQLKGGAELEDQAEEFWRI